MSLNVVCHLGAIKVFSESSALYALQIHFTLPENSPELAYMVVHFMLAVLQKTYTRKREFSFFCKRAEDFGVGFSIMVGMLGRGICIITYRSRVAVRETPMAS